MTYLASFCRQRLRAQRRMAAQSTFPMRVEAAAKDHQTTSGYSSLERTLYVSVRSHF